MEELTWFEEYWMLLATCVSAGLIIFWLHYDSPEKVRERLLRRRGKAMLDARRAYLLARVADHLTRGLENDLYNGDMSRKEVNALYKEIGTKVGIRDLLPKNGKLSLSLLKKEITHRLSDGTYFEFKPDANGADVRKPPIPFPG